MQRTLLGFVFLSSFVLFPALFLAEATSVIPPRAVDIRPYQTANVLNAVNQTAKKPAEAVSQTTNKFKHTFISNLYHGVRGGEVKALQLALYAEGLFKGDATGNYYDQTYSAVKKFQKKYGIKATGYAGPATRAKLNELYSK